MPDSEDDDPLLDVGAGVGAEVLAMDVAVLETHFLQSFAAVAVVPPLESVFK